MRRPATTVSATGMNVQCGRQPPPPSRPALPLALRFNTSHAHIPFHAFPRLGTRRDAQPALIATPRLGTLASMLKYNTLEPKIEGESGRDGSRPSERAVYRWHTS
ncbi:hypothetical protein PVAP13_2KG166532 [Panicum virgatum]|uniref:Uncharacterized protein n=1 Tax=Panicum virgatum TaxID=38727 RepID=A0A8T0W1M1_PANVG|nr:hypothetical protein PVAP13_2KG166532 [Panicum virgatum]